ncbi:YesK family protein [Lysinibacillus sphaericus]|uniref:YesK family protein n=1 Tax=Lysinibacillus sphaericus TaxID=1421 RepID=UPI003F7974A7
MNAFMLEGWTPILLLGAIFIVGIYLISRKVSRKALFTVSLVLSLICLGFVIYSIFVVGGWEGMGLGFVAISVLLGTWLGTIIGISSKNISV